MPDIIMFSYLNDHLLKNEAIKKHEESQLKEPGTVFDIVTHSLLVATTTTTTTTTTAATKTSIHPLL